MANVFYEKDADSSLVASRKVAIVGYGSQGACPRPHLKDSGVDVRVALREGSSSRAKAEGRRPSRRADRPGRGRSRLIMIAAARHRAARDVYEQSIAPHLNGGDAIFFAHGFNIRFGQIKPADGIDVAMVAPEGPRPSRAPHLHRGRRACRASSRSRRTRAGRPKTSRCPTPTRSAARAPVCSRRHSRRRPRPTSSVSRSCCAAGSRRSCRPASTRSSTPGTSPSPRTSSVSTS